MNADVDIDLLLYRWQTVSAALAEAEARDPYSYHVDDLADEVINARLALTQAGVRDIDALTSSQHQLLTAQAAVLENALR
jgi:hypothetical protein